MIVFVYLQYLPNCSMAPSYHDAVNDNCNNKRTNTFIIYKYIKSLKIYMKKDYIYLSMEINMY